MATGAISRVSTTATGAGAGGYNAGAAFSPDGARVAFWSTSSLLAPDAVEFGNSSDVFVKDLVTGAVIQVSVDPRGKEGDASSYEPVFSPDGSRVAFYSSAKNLVAPDTNGFNSDIFVATLSAPPAPNRAPVITSDDGGDVADLSVEEGDLSVTIVRASDPDPNAALTFAITGGDDAARFSIDRLSGAVRLAGALNFEEPEDAGVTEPTRSACRSATAGFRTSSF